MTKDLTVLLAEDDDAIVILATEMLNRNKSVKQVICFRNGRKILDYLFSCPDIDSEILLVLLDIRMLLSIEDEVIKEIRNDDNLKYLPIIVFSSVIDPNIVSLCYSYGCDAFISKNDFDVFEYLSKVDFQGIVQASDAHRKSFLPAETVYQIDNSTNVRCVSYSYNEKKEFYEF